MERKPKVIEIEFLKSIPYGDENSYQPNLDISYPTKVSMFDYKCSGCGFAVYKVKNMIFNNCQEAIEVAIAEGESVVRECSRYYTVDVFGEKTFLSLTEVIINGCDFWNLDFTDSSESNIPPNAEEIVSEIFND